MSTPAAAVEAIDLEKALGETRALKGVSFAVPRGTILGPLVPNAKMADQVMVSLTMPLSFLANTFASLQGLPDWLRPFANWNPLTPVVASMRQLFGNASTITPAHQPWTLEHPIEAAIS